MQISNCQWRPVAFVGFTSEWKRRIGGATPGFASLLAFLPLLDLPLPQVDPPADRLSSDPQDHAGSHHTAGAHVSCAELSGRLLRTGHSGRENRCRWPTDTFGTVLAFERQPMCKTHTHIYTHIYIYICTVARRCQARRYWIPWTPRRNGVSATRQAVFRLLDILYQKNFGRGATRSLH